MAARVENMLDLNVKLNQGIEGGFTQEHLGILQSLTKKFREQEFRVCIEKAVLGKLVEVLSKLSDEFHLLNSEETDSRGSPLCLQMTAECFRSLRNACVQCERNQCLMRDLGFIKVTLRLLGALSKRQLVNADCMHEALRCGIQFLGNLAAGNQVCKDDIWKHAFPHPFLGLLEHCDVKSVSYTCMVLHTCLDPLKVGEPLLRQELLHMSRKVIALCQREQEPEQEQEQQQEWAILIVTQHVLKSPEVFQRTFAELTNQERVTLLELMAAQLSEPEQAPVRPAVPAGLARYLASVFLDRCRAVLTLASPSSSDDQEAVTVMRLLDVLCEMTADHQQFMFLQDYPDLLQTTVELLREVHAVGKAGRNAFSAQQDFSASGAAAPCPAGSFKAHLVRLIGNLCHANSSNQSKVRELEGIPLVLDNCSIDSNNPFISQWAVFAIRILLEHNPENQAVVRALERRGVADDSALREMGYRLEERDGSLLLKPTSRDS